MPAYKHVSSLILLSLSLSLAVAPSLAQAKTPRYTVTVLAPSGNARAINNLGDVVGSYSSPFQRAFIHTGGVLHDLGLQGGHHDSAASGINDARQIVGVTITADFRRQAFQYNWGGVAQDLGTLGGPTSSATAINAAGQVVGSATLDPSHAVAFLSWGGVMQNLGGFPGGESSAATAINDAGLVTGSAVVGQLQAPPPDGGRQHAFLYRQGVMHDIGTLPGGRVSWGNAINEAGDVAGYSNSHNLDIYHAILYSQGKMSDLGSLQHGNSSYATGINNLGQVVGFAAIGPGRAAFYYQKRGGMRDLASLINSPTAWQITLASGINDRGQIAARGCQVGQCQKESALRLDPVPDENEDEDEDEADTAVEAEQALDRNATAAASVQAPVANGYVITAPISAAGSLLQPAPVAN